MKLRNIFLAGLAVCTMASCSKDETIDYSQMGEVDAYVSFTATSALSTKATVDSENKELLDGEKYINSLTAYVFKDAATDDQKKLAGVKHITMEDADAALKGDFGLQAINHVVVKVTPNAEGTSSTDQFVAVLVANCEKLNVSSLAGLKSATITGNISTYEPSKVASTSVFLPMVSAEIPFGGLVPNITVNGETTTYTENWLQGGSANIEHQTSDEGDPTSIPKNLTSISLERLVARVQVEKLIFNLEQNYPGATFELDTLSLVNVRPTSTIKGGNGQYVKGYQSDGYAKSQKWICPSSETEQTLAKEYTYEAFSGSNVSVDFTNDALYKNDKFCVYAFSNEEVPEGQEDVADGATTDNNIYQTALLISGKFKRSSDAPAETRHFRVLLKDQDQPVKVLKNHVYKLTVTITGEGSPNEDEILLNAHVAAQITVAPWNVIEQNEEDAN